MRPSPAAERKGKDCSETPRGSRPRLGGGRDRAQRRAPRDVTSADHCTGDEYCTLLALIAPVCIEALIYLGNEAEEKFDEIGELIGGPDPTPSPTPTQSPTDGQTSTASGSPTNSSADSPTTAASPQQSSTTDLGKPDIRVESVEPTLTHIDLSLPNGSVSLYIDSKTGDVVALRTEDSCSIAPGGGN